MRSTEEIETKIRELRKEYKGLGQRRSVIVDCGGVLVEGELINVVDQIEDTLLKIDVLRWVLERGGFPCE